jgi:hypothetical protein
MFGFGGFFPRVGPFGVLPSYIPYLVANGWGRCGCYTPYPYPVPFYPLSPFPFYPRLF